MPPDVVREGPDVLIALVGTFLQRLHDDGVEIAAAGPAQTLSRGRALFQDGSRLRPAGGEPARHLARPQRLLRGQGGQHRRVGGFAGGHRGMPPHEQLIEEDAQRIHVGRRRHRAAGRLFGSGIFRGERSAEREGRTGGRSGVGQGRDAEVEQLHLPACVHEHVGGLEIAMHDEVRMRVRDGVGHLQEQIEPGGGVEPALRRVAIDARALDVLEDEVWLPGLRDACVEKPRDVRVRQPREQRALTPEPLVTQPIPHGEVDELDRGLALEAAVAAARQPHRTHAAHPERPNERVAADGLPGHRRRLARNWRRLEEVRGQDALMLGKELLERGGQRGILAADRRHELGAGRWIQIEGPIEQRTQAMPQCPVHFAHAASIPGITPGWTASLV
jgi:hypothetical protein